MHRKITLSIFVLTAMLAGGCSNGSGETSMITEDNAKEIALSHASLTADQVTFIKSNIDTDDGRKHYEVEFYTPDNKEYDYEIDPYSGEILDFDYDAEAF